MIGWDDLYKVVVSMFPLYVALVLGFGSVKWWHLFAREQCDGINRFITLFILPLFGFEFIARMNPFAMNFRPVAADALSKLTTLAILALWERFSSLASYSWCIMTFSLCTLTNLLIVGMPVVQATYGEWGVDLVVQLCMLQSLVWLPLLLLLLEFRKRRMIDLATSPPESDCVVEEERDIDRSVVNTSEVGDDDDEKRSHAPLTMVWIKIVMNPNVYANVLGLAWALLASRLWMKLQILVANLLLIKGCSAIFFGGALADFFYEFVKEIIKCTTNTHVCLFIPWEIGNGFIGLLAFKFTMPSILKGLIEIMSKAGTGTVMFNIGIFIAMQTKVIACGTGPTVLGMVSRFVVGPAIMALCSLAVDLHGPALRVAIIQAALPQAIIDFVFANEYGLHADVLSIAVVFSTMTSLPMLIGYYIALEYAA